MYFPLSLSPSLLHNPTPKMGIDYDSALIFGWFLDSKKARKYLNIIENDEDAPVYPSDLEECINEEEPPQKKQKTGSPLPRPKTFSVWAMPQWYEADDEDGGLLYYLAHDESGEEESASVEEMVKIAASDDAKVAQELAIALGGKSGGLRAMSTLCVN